MLEKAYEESNNQFIMRVSNRYSKNETSCKAESLDMGIASTIEATSRVLLCLRVAESVPKAYIN